MSTSPDYVQIARELGLVRVSYPILRACRVGNVLVAIGEREDGTRQVEQAVATYRGALEERLVQPAEPGIATADARRGSHGDWR